MKDCFKNETTVAIEQLGMRDNSLTQNVEEKLLKRLNAGCNMQKAGGHLEKSIADPSSFRTVVGRLLGNGTVSIFHASVVGGVGSADLWRRTALRRNAHARWRWPATEQTARDGERLCAERDVKSCARRCTTKLVANHYTGVGRIFTRGQQWWNFILSTWN